MVGLNPIAKGRSIGYYVNLTCRSTRLQIVVALLESTSNPYTLMKTLPKKFLLLILATGFIALVCTGCQTTQGFGEDVEDLGEKIQGE